MRVRNFSAVLVITGFLVGCSATHHQEALTAPSEGMRTDGEVLIATPENGTYDGREYQDSGSMTANIVRSAFLRHAHNVMVSSDCEVLSCLQESDVAADYHVVPVILHWENRATEWSGKRDKVKVRLSVFDGQSGSELSSIIISGKSKWATLGGDHPQHLLPEPINGYVDSL